MAEVLFADISDVHRFGESCVFNEMGSKDIQYLTILKKIGGVTISIAGYLAFAMLVLVHVILYLYSKPSKKKNDLVNQVAQDKTKIRRTMLGIGRY